MTIITERDSRMESLLDVAKKMIMAARTAPKARGRSNLQMAIVTDGDIQKLASRMREIGEKEDNQIFIRDAHNVLKSADVVVLFGTSIKSMGLSQCGYCGFRDCAAKDAHPLIPCAFNTGDLGIAIGSAVAVAMDNRVDNRIMWSAGVAARELKLLGEDVQIVYAVPLSAESKNPFFDRK